MAEVESPKPGRIEQTELVPRSIEQVRTMIVARLPEPTFVVPRRRPPSRPRIVVKRRLAPHHVVAGAIAFALVAFAVAVVVLLAAETPRAVPVDASAAPGAVLSGAAAPVDDAVASPPAAPVPAVPAVPAAPVAGAVPLAPLAGGADPRGATSGDAVALAPLAGVAARGSDRARGDDAPVNDARRDAAGARQPGEHARAPAARDRQAPKAPATSTTSTTESAGDALFERVFTAGDTP